MADTKVFRLINNVTVEMIGQSVEGFLRDQKGMITQAGQTAEGYIVQGKQQASGWRRISGTDQAISVQIFQADEIINVTAGFGKWADKIGAGVVGTILFTPLAITAAIGAVIQKKLPSEIFGFIEKFILTGGQSASVGLYGGKMITDNEVLCPLCKTPNSKGIKFCKQCGTKLLENCKQCGADIPQGFKFCPECGFPVNTEKTCPSCGTAYKVGQKFCFECGTSLITKS